MPPTNAAAAAAVAVNGQLRRRAPLQEDFNRRAAAHPFARRSARLSQCLPAVQAQCCTAPKSAAVIAATVAVAVERRLVGGKPTANRLY